MLFDQRSGAMIVLDSVAAFVVRHRDHFADFAEAAVALADTFDADPARVGADLHQLVSRIDEFDRDEERPASSSIGGRAPRRRAPT